MIFHSFTSIHIARNYVSRVQRIISLKANSFLGNYIRDLLLAFISLLIAENINLYISFCRRNDNPSRSLLAALHHRFLLGERCDLKVNIRFLNLQGWQYRFVFSRKEEQALNDRDEGGSCRCSRQIAHVISVTWQRERQLSYNCRGAANLRKIIV